MKCPACHVENDFHWVMATNEDGWTCHCGHNPGEPSGFCPQLDRELLARKVNAVLSTMHHFELVYVSNGDEGDWLVNDVVAACKLKDRYDQYSIIAEIMASFGSRHRDYWKQISDGVLSGNDPRQRCHCGKLAMASSGDRHRCSEHHAELFS